MHVWAIRRFGSKKICLGEWVRRRRIRGVWSQQQLALAFSLLRSSIGIILSNLRICGNSQQHIDSCFYQTFFSPTTGICRFVLNSITEELKREEWGGDGGPAVHLLIVREKNANRAHTWSYVQRMGTHLHKSIVLTIVCLLSISYYTSLSTDNSMYLLFSLCTRILIGRE